MKKLKVMLYAIVLIMSAVWVCAAETEEFPHIEMELPYHGTTPREAAISLFRIDSESIDISTQIYSNILKLEDPDVFLQNDTGLSVLNPWDQMTQQELDIVKGWAEDITQDCVTADEKIYAVMEYVASNVYYDWDFFLSWDGDSDQYMQMLNHNAYDVITNKTAVCYGYAATASALLQISGVPCIIIESPNHAWNMAYNGTRWVLFDTTWISANKYEDGTFKTNTNLVLEWFDFDIEKANSESSHLITGADYCEYGNTVYSAPIHTVKGSFEIPSGVTAIGEMAFYNKYGQNELSITGDFSKIVSIGKGAFYYCEGLDGVIDLRNVVNIYEQAFRGCASLDGITGLDSAAYIESAAFYECNSLDGVINLGELENIPSHTFYQCGNIDGIEGTENISSIGYAAFCECSQLSGIVDLMNAESIGEASFYFTNLSRVYIPNNDIELGSHAFSNSPVTIYAHTDSNAHIFAEYFGIPFEDIDSLSFTVSYDADGGSNAPADHVKSYGETAVISETIPEKQSFEFIAWSTEQNGAAEYLPGASYTKNKDLTLYALWELVVLYGDAQSDGKIDVTDVIVVLQRIASTTTGLLPDGADANGDGSFDVTDVIKILQYIASPGTTVLGPAV